MQSPVSVGQRFPLTIKRLDINGAGIGYYKRKITFVTGALPQEVVIAEVTRVSPHFLTAKVHRIRQKSPDRVTPTEPLYGQVGGVELNHLSYPGQLNFKRDVVAQALAKFKPRGWQHYDLRPTIGMADPEHYRNKAQFPLAVIDGHVKAGLYAPNSHRLVPFTSFLTQAPLTMHVINTLCQLIEAAQIPIYNEQTNQGDLRTLIVRESSLGEVQVTFVTRTPILPQQAKLLRDISIKLPEVVSVSQNINPDKTALIWGPETQLLAGKARISQPILGKTFELSPQAFLQLNPEQTEQLYRIARKALAPKPTDILVDAYAGAGTIGLTLADSVAAVYGMELIPEAVADAKRNAQLNHIENAHYEVGPAENIFPKWLATGIRPNAVIVDPPRVGLDPAFIQALLTLDPEKFVYISCNPSTLARDLVAITEKYDVKWIRSIDMFPQTARCEAVVKLTRKQA